MRGKQPGGVTGGQAVHGYGMIGLERVEIVRVLQKEDTKQHTLNSVADVVKGRNVCVDTSS